MTKIEQEIIEHLKRGESEPSISAWEVALNCACAIAFIIGLLGIMALLIWGTEPQHGAEYDIESTMEDAR